MGSFFSLLFPLHPGTVGVSCLDLEVGVHRWEEAGCKCRGGWFSGFPESSQGRICPSRSQGGSKAVMLG